MAPDSNYDYENDLGDGIHNFQLGGLSQPLNPHAAPYSASYEGQGQTPELRQTEVMQSLFRFPPPSHKPQPQPLFPTSPGIPNSFPFPPPLDSGAFPSLPPPANPPPGYPMYSSEGSRTPSSQGGSSTCPNSPFAPMPPLDTDILPEKPKKPKRARGRTGSVIKIREYPVNLNPAAREFVPASYGTTNPNYFNQPQPEKAGNVPEANENKLGLAEAKFSRGTLGESLFKNLGIPYAEPEDFDTGENMQEATEDYDFNFTFLRPLFEFGSAHYDEDSQEYYVEKLIRSFK